VGRVAVKAIVFFEVVTTIGLILGAVAINIAKAGVGVVLPASVQSVAPIAHEAGWQSVLLNIFPENIALAVAQNQISAGGRVCPSVRRGAGYVARSKARPRW